MTRTVELALLTVFMVIVLLVASLILGSRGWLPSPFSGARGLQQPASQVANGGLAATR
jgi:hypothetical protein